MITLSPLPSPESICFRQLGLHEQPKALRAYEKILQAEARAVRDEAPNGNLMLARVVGHFLLEFYDQRHILGDRPFTKVVDEVTLPSLVRGNIKDDDMVVFAVGQRYRDMIRAFMTPAEPYSPPPSPTSPPSYDTLEDMIEDYVQSSGDDHQAARKKALARDGFRCVVTGAFDEASIECNPELQRQQQDLDALIVVLETTRIANEPTTQGIGTGERGAIVNKGCHAPGITSSLQHFGLEHLATSLLAVGGVHEVWNLLSMQSDMHRRFDRLDLSFAPIDKPNCYQIRVFRQYIENNIRRRSDYPGMSTPGAPMLVDLSSRCRGLPPPNSQLLVFHATCAWAANMSGVTDFVNKLERDAREAHGPRLRLVVS